MERYIRDRALGAVNRKPKPLAVGWQITIGIFAGAIGMWLFVALMFSVGR